MKYYEGKKNENLDIRLDRIDDIFIIYFVQFLSAGGFDKTISR